MPSKGSKPAVAGENPLAERVGVALPSKGISRQPMFGGVCFMLNGNMLAGASKRGLLLRVGKEAYGPALKRVGTRPMEMRGKPMEGYLYVDPTRLSDAALRDWLQLAIDFVKTLPPKAGKLVEKPAKGKRK